MEESIKILEDYIKLISKGYCDDCNELCNIYSTPSFPSRAISKAIENLIKGYREIEEISDKNSLLVEELKNENNSLNLSIKIFKKDYIPKSKIKEKITEIGKEYAEDEIDCETYSFMKEILQELMEDK